MAAKLRNTTQTAKTPAQQVREEIDRTNARLRHFRGIAVGVLSAALAVWSEIWEACQDPRSCEDILEGIPGPPSQFASKEWAEYLEKLHLVGIYLDYAKRLCEGSIDHQRSQESEVAVCLDSSQSFQAANQPKNTRFCRPKKE